MQGCEHITNTGYEQTLKTSGFSGIEVIWTKEIGAAIIVYFIERMPSMFSPEGISETHRIAQIIGSQRTWSMIVDR